MIDLEQGDPNNLKGKVIAYSRFIDLNKNHKGTILEPIHDGDLILIYATIYRSEFSRKNKGLGIPEIKINDIINDSDGRVREIYDFYQGKLPEESKKFSVYSIALYNNEGSLPICLEDIIFAGEYSDVKRCLNADQSMINRYMLELEEQNSRRQGIFSLNKNTKKPVKTYESINKDEIQQHIINKYIVPMDRAIKNGFTKEFEEIKNEFITKFSEGYNLELNDFMQIPFLIKKGEKENIDLANIYLHKIVALKNEKYEEMPALIKQIEELRKRKQ